MRILLYGRIFWNNIGITIPGNKSIWEIDELRYLKLYLKGITANAMNSMKMGNYSLE